MSTNTETKSTRGRAKDTEGYARDYGLPKRYSEDLKNLTPRHVVLAVPPGNTGFPLVNAGSKFFAIAEASPGLQSPPQKLSALARSLSPEDPSAVIVLAASSFPIEDPVGLSVDALLEFAKVSDSTEQPKTDGEGEGTLQGTDNGKAMGDNPKTIDDSLLAQLSKSAITAAGVAGIAAGFVAGFVLANLM